MTTLSRTGEVNHPQYYTGRNIGYECIDIVQYQSFCVGNVIKYLWRYRDKGRPLEDLRKARWYAHRAHVMREMVDINVGCCRRILVDLVATSQGYESAVWVGLLEGEWQVALTGLDMMIREEEAGTCPTSLS